MPLIHELHAKVQAADEAWSAALKNAFGKQAGDRRYDADKSRHPAECTARLADLKDADAAFQAAGGWNVWRKTSIQKSKG